MTGVITATITKIEDSDEEQMDPQYSLLSIDIIKEVNKLPAAELVLLDGNPAQQTFELSDSGFFQPGNKIKIQLRYEEETDAEVFIGFVVKHTLSASRKKSVLTLYLKDAAIKLTQLRKNAIFRDKDDLAIIEDIVNTAVEKDGKQNIKLQPCKSLGALSPHAEMVQFYCSDWDFILSRAAANGWWIVVNDGVVEVKPPKLIQGEATSLVYGLDAIYDWEIEADLRDQFASVEATAWNGQEQTLVAPQAGAKYSLEQPDLVPASLGPLIGADKCQLVSGAELAKEEVEAWASAKVVETRLSMVKGRIQVPGRTDLKPGDWLELEKFSQHFNGKILITGVRHQVNEGGWLTNLQFGLSATAFVPSDEIMATPANGLLPAVHGLQVGVVKQADLKDELRVQVQIPRLTPTSDTKTPDKYDGLVWARLATLEAGLTAPNSGQGRGTVFRPESGDEVILGFLNDDPRQAVILGSLYSELNPSPSKVEAKNNTRGIFTKQQLNLVFNDEEQSITLETLNKNTILISEKKGAEGIQITDQYNNKIVMDKTGIQISSDKNIEITAKENITLQGKKVDVK